ncbi:hypothetical protein [uncultured Tateyamaria sp.]|uniref:hypothetical protein n=1 Tax=uncultured Tateyamaria sp. TaxID=455651 RepID=UPI00262D4883|nr:hypothetical protein [uncultured Tateyamaria sp.]
MAEVPGSNIRDDLPTELHQFIEEMADEEVLIFLRSFIVVGANEKSQTTIGDLVYEMLLWPYVKKVWREAEGSPGVAGRIRMLMDTLRISEAALEAETGRKRRVPRIVNLNAFLEQYAEGSVFA